MPEAARQLAALERQLREDAGDREAWQDLARLVARTGARPRFLAADRHLEVLLQLARERPEERALARMALDLLGLEAEDLAPVEASTGLPSRVRRVADGATMVLVPGTRFHSRRPGREVLDDLPTVREVGAHYMDRTAVTAGRYALFLEHTAHRPPRHWRRQLARPERPVVFVDWMDVAAYAAFCGGRPPTESEWELATGAATLQRFPWGDEDPGPARANVRFGAERRDPRDFDAHLGAADGFPAGAGPTGVLGLLGNVCELCLEDGVRFPPAQAPAAAGREALAQVPGRDHGAVSRGASWLHADADLARPPRRPLGPRHGESTLGFRLVVPLTRGTP